MMLCIFISAMGLRKNIIYGIIHLEMMEVSINTNWKMNDAEDVSRFVKAQVRMYETALEEVRNGWKESH